MERLKNFLENVFFSRSPEKFLWRPFFFGDCLKNFCEDLFFFFWRALALVSLVLGLEHSCPWPRECLSLASDFFLCPWPRALCPRLHLWLLRIIFVLIKLFFYSSSNLPSCHRRASSNPSPSPERPPQSQHCSRICLEFLVGEFYACSFSCVLSYCLYLCNKFFLLFNSIIYKKNSTL